MGAPRLLKLSHASESLTKSRCASRMCTEDYGRIDRLMTTLELHRVRISCLENYESTYIMLKSVSYLPRINETDFV